MASAMTQVISPPSLNDVVNSRVVAALKKRLALLQAEVDKSADELVRRLPIEISTLAEAAEAEKTYNYFWFQNTLYSTQMQARIASTLIDICSTYVVVNTDVWQNIVKEAH